MLQKSIIYTDDQIDEAIAYLQKNKPVPVVGNPVPLPQWEMLYNSNGWLGYPLNTQFPEDNIPMSWNKPFTGGLGAWDGSGKDKVIAQIRARANGKRVMYQSIRETALNKESSIGSRLFHNGYDNRWLFWILNFGDAAPSHTARIRSAITYLNRFHLPGGDGKFCQTFYEFKTLEDSRPTAVKILMRQEPDGYHYFYMELAEKKFEAMSREPIAFGVPLLHELVIEFKKTNDALVRFTCGKTVVEGHSNTVNPSNGTIGGAHLIYSNEIGLGEEAAFEVEDYTIERKLA